MLREEQDMEYQRSMEMDRQNRERARQEEELKRKLEEEQAQRVELDAAIALSKQLEAEGVLARKRKLVEERLVPDNSTAEGVALIRFQLPQGSKISRKFMKFDTVEVRC